MFELALWFAAWEITQIPVPFQQVTEIPGRESTESTIQVKRKQKGSEAGSQVIRLGGSHLHKNKQNSNWKC